MIPNSTVPSYGTIEIIFPYVYTAGLGIITSAPYTGSITCNSTCALTSPYTVAITVPKEILSNVRNLLIFFIIN